MQTVSDITIFERNRIKESSLWNLPEERELLLHRIHAYPAKFPPFLVQKLIEHFESLDKRVQHVADTFCGCGTSALESAKLGKDFWGCDINPVATLIARTKSRPYRSNYLRQLHQEIVARTKQSAILAPKRYSDHERLKYWFDTASIHKLYRLLYAILYVVPEGKYRDFFLTGFSNILKPCSRWLTKSIKPQIDPKKITAEPLSAFDKQIKAMIKAVDQALQSVEFKSQVKIVNHNLLSLQVESFADVVITSPPYVTSYEYADLHQLSAIWLGYTDDYRTLRKGSIGSDHHPNEVEDLYHHVNHPARIAYDRLRELDNSKARSVLRYFYDLNLSVQKVKAILNTGGSVAFVIGNTSYKGISIDNAKVLTQCLLDSEFKNVKVSKRRISYKILTPFRNRLGRFTSHARGRKVYSHEFILTGEK
jgi:methylase of polypeptide subunit release factors